MTDEELNAIEARAKAAPEGVMKVDESGFLRPATPTCKMPAHRDCSVGQIVWLNQSHEEGFNRELAAFFAQAGPDVLALIVEVRRLRSVAAAARAEGRADGLTDAAMAVCDDCAAYGTRYLRRVEDWQEVDDTHAVRGWVHVYPPVEPEWGERFVECKAAAVRALGGEEGEAK